MTKILLKDYIYHGRIKEHFQLKGTLLSEISKTDSHTIKPMKGCPHQISKLDWDYSEEFDRPWVQEFGNHFLRAIAEFIDDDSTIDNETVDIHQIWYQQYVESDIHDWHIHGGQFTGVYYLEHPSDSAKTEVVSPYDKRVIAIDAKEGDIIIFPAHIKHRGSKNSCKRKTIISFNFSIGE
tara:strand:+ start:297 stop:836 length:540 start_codon:yes stop_codon:yes gene_type:complete